MKGMEKQTMDADYTRNIPTLSNAARSASINIPTPSDSSRSSSIGGNGARFGALDMMTFSTFSPLNYGNSGAGYMYTASMGGNWFQCPINVPFCERES